MTEKANGNGKHVEKEEEPQENQEDESEGSGEEVEYEVESIVGRRPSKELKGHFEYLLKWKGYDEPTWEPEGSLSCPELLKAYNDAHPFKAKKETAPKIRRPPVKNTDGKPAKRTKTDDAPTVGFEFGDEVADIIGARMEDELMLFVSWKDKEERSFVPSKVANAKIPQQVISFYESRLRLSLL